MQEESAIAHTWLVGPDGHIGQGRHYANRQMVVTCHAAMCLIILLYFPHLVSLEVDTDMFSNTVGYCTVQGILFLFSGQPYYYNHVGVPTCMTPLGQCGETTEP